MNFDISGLLNQVIDHAPYPIGKSNLVQFAQQHGASDQVVGLLQRLPDKTFNSSQDVKNELNNLGNIGGLKL